MQMPAAVQTDNAAKIPYYEHSGVQSLKLYRAVFYSLHDQK